MVLVTFLFSSRCQKREHSLVALDFGMIWGVKVDKPRGNQIERNQNRMGAGCSYEASPP